VGLRIAYLQRITILASVADEHVYVTHLDLEKVLRWAVDLLEAL